MQRNSVLVLVALGLGAGLLLGLLLAGPRVAASAPAADGAHQATLRQLTEAVDRLRKTFAARPTGLVASTAPAEPEPATRALTRRPVAEEELAARIASLEAQLQAAAWTGASGAGTGAILPAGAPPATRWEQVRQLAAAANSEDERVYENARRSVRLRSPRQILQRFGMPDGVHSLENGRMLWSYEPPDGADGLDIFFVHGLATLP